MKVSFSDIARGAGSGIVKDTGWSGACGLDFSKEPQAEITLYLLDDKTAAAEGVVKATANSQCSRCGDPVEFSIDSDFKYIFRLGQDDSLHIKEKECDEDECLTVFVEEPVVDRSEILEEQLILSVPEKLLCKKNCKGLCHTCGASLNTEACQCSDDHSDSPFSVLKKLKK